MTSYSTPEEFYKGAMANIFKITGSKLKILGVSSNDIPELVETGRLTKWTSDVVDGIVLEMIDYDGIKLAEFEWTENSITQRDIHKDERDFRRTI